MLTLLKQMRLEREEGFTLIELLVVIVIIGVLAAIALPIFLNQQKAAAQAAVKSDVRKAVTSVSTHLVKFPTAPDVSIVDKGASSDGVSTIIVGGWNDYIICGQTEASDDWSFSYSSTTGRFTANEDGDCSTIPTPDSNTNPTTPGNGGVVIPSDCEFAGGANACAARDAAVQFLADFKAWEAQAEEGDLFDDSGLKMPDNITAVLPNGYAAVWSAGRIEFNISAVNGQALNGVYVYSSRGGGFQGIGADFVIVEK